MGEINVFDLEDVGYRAYAQKLPCYDSLLFRTLSLDVWNPEDYPIINLDGIIPINRMKHLLPSNSRMFRFSQSRTYLSGPWYVIHRGALVIEKFIFEEDTTFELKFNDNHLVFSLETINKEVCVGSLPLYPLHFCTIGIRLPKSLELKIVYNDLVHIEDLSKTSGYFDDRLIHIGDQFLISTRYGSVEKYFPEEDDNDGSYCHRQVKPLMDPNKRKMISDLAMLFFEEVGVNPEFIVTESGFLFS